MLVSGPKSTGHSSTRYGKCEICGEHVPDVWIGKRRDGWHVFGHELCVLNNINEGLNAETKD